MCAGAFLVIRPLQRRRGNTQSRSSKHQSLEIIKSLNGKRLNSGKSKDLLLLFSLLLLSSFSPSLNNTQALQTEKQDLLLNPITATDGSVVVIIIIIIIIISMDDKSFWMHRCR